jgi:ribosome-associated translation inhibitor RaiA
MQYLDNRSHFRVEIHTQDCDVPPDERARLQRFLDPLEEAVADFPEACLWINVVYHPRRQEYHAETKLKLPGRTLFSGAYDAYLDSALERAIGRLVRKVSVYRENPDRQAMESAERAAGLDREIVAPEDPDVGPLAEASEAGDYRAFRMGLIGYEEWLRKRVGRWIEREPEAQARVGDELLIGDLVEEVYLHAFENFAHRPTDIRLSEWLDKLIDPSLRDLLRHPEREHEAASFARTVRETPM